MVHISYSGVVTRLKVPVLVVDNCALLRLARLCGVQYYTAVHVGWAFV